MRRGDLLLYAVTDRRWLQGRDLEGDARKALEGGATALQLREKNLDEKTFMDEARALKALCAEFRVPFIVNDNVEAVKKIGADGVHIGQSDMEVSAARKILGPGKIIGVSARTAGEAAAAERLGADYIGAGAVFPTASKDDAAEVTPGALREICLAVKIPVVAIGGINEGNISLLRGSGAAGVAVISAIFAQGDIAAAAARLKAKAARLFRKEGA